MDKDNKIYSVYIHTFPNNKKYIGLTCQKVKLRWNNGRGYKQHRYMYNAILKYGWDNVNHEVINNLSKKEACLLEIELIKKYNSNNKKYGYNLSTGGEHGSLGVNPSQETRNKMSEKFKGRIVSSDTRSKLSKQASKQWESQDNRTKNMILQPHKRSVLQYDLKGNFLNKFITMSEASRCTKTQRSKISLVCNGKRKTTGGFMWKYDGDLYG